MQAIIDSTDFAISVAESVAASVDAAVVVFDWDLRIKSANGAFYRAFGTPPEDARDTSLLTVSDRLWEVSQLRSLLRHVVDEGKPFRDIEIEQEIPNSRKSAAGGEVGAASAISNWWCS